jgi:hypothetical protein
MAYWNEYFAKGFEWFADEKVFFEKIDAGLYDGKYCQMEWFAPVVEKG